MINCRLFRSHLASSMRAKQKPRIAVHPYSQASPLLVCMRVRVHVCVCVYVCASDVFIPVKPLSTALQDMDHILFGLRLAYPSLLLTFAADLMADPPTAANGEGRTISAPLPAAEEGEKESVFTEAVSPHAADFSFCFHVWEWRERECRNSAPLPAAEEGGKEIVSGEVRPPDLKISLCKYIHARDGRGSVHCASPRYRGRARRWYSHRQ